MTSTSMFGDLSPSEKLQLVEDLWDDLASSPEDVPVHEWQKVELARRRANLENNPASVLTWQEIKRRVQEQHGASRATLVAASANVCPPIVRTLVTLSTIE